MRQPIKELILADMVTCSVGVQTSCPNSPIPRHDNNVETIGEYICPGHFTDIHITKLEDTFSKRQKPDDIRLQILAMECNLLYKDVKDWFKARRLKWITDLVQNDSCDNDTNNNNDVKSNEKISATTSSNSNTLKKHSTNHDTKIKRIITPTT